MTTRAALIASLCLGIPTGTGSESFAGRTMVNMAGWEDAQIILTQAFNPGAGSGGPGLGEFPAGSTAQAYLFDDSTDECVYWSMQLPHSYDVTPSPTALKCHMHWSPITTSTNAVNWQIDYSVTGIDQVVGASAMLDISDAGDGVAYGHQVAEFADIACTNCTISSILLVRVCRDANGTNGTDSMAGDVAGLAFDCHIQIDSFGSATYSAK